MRSKQDQRERRTQTKLFLSDHFEYCSLVWQDTILRLVLEFQLNLQASQEKSSLLSLHMMPLIAHSASL